MWPPLGGSSPLPCTFKDNNGRRDSAGSFSGVLYVVMVAFPFFLKPIFYEKNSILSPIGPGLCFMYG